MENYKRNHILTLFEDFFQSLIKSIIPIIIVFAGRLGNKESGFLSGGILVAIFMAILLINALTTILKWYKNVYYIDDNFIVQRSGILVIKRREIPFNKVQTINISQNIMQRIFSLASVKIDTGNSSYNASEVSIKIKKSDAESIREIILGARNKNEQSEMSVEERAEVDSDSTTDDTTGSIKESSTESSTESTTESTTKSTTKSTIGGSTDSVTNIKASSITNRKSETASKQYKVTNKELLASGLTSNAVFAGLAFLGSIYALLNDYLASLLDDSLESLGRFIGDVDFSHMPLSRIILFIGSIIFVFIIFSFILSIVGTYIKYYGFTVKREVRNIVISYGLFERKNYVIPSAKIKALYIRQNFLRQLMGLYAINVESIGYGNEKGEEAILFPIAMVGRKMEIIAGLLPEYIFEEELMRVPKTALRRFIISSAMFPLLVCIVLTVSFGFGWLSFILLPVFILNGFLEYRNSAIGVNDRLLCMNNGAFTKSISLVAISDIQSATDRSNIMQRRRGLFNYIISIQSNVFGKTIEVRYLSADLKKMLLGII